MEELNSKYKIAQDISISMETRKIYFFAFSLPILIINMAVFFSVWGFMATFKKSAWMFNFFVLVFFVAVLFRGSIYAHEYIHGYTWRWLGKIPKDKVTYNYNKKARMLYVHAAEPLRASAYRWGIAMPFIVLGEIPAVIGIITGEPSVFGYGLIFILVSGGDIAGLWKIRKIKSRVYVQDHPERIGCYVLEEAH